MWILSEKMWFHLKLLFAKNMRKAERALAFRISGSKCPFLLFIAALQFQVFYEPSVR